MRVQGLGFRVGVQDWLGFGVQRLEFSVQGLEFSDQDQDQELGLRVQGSCLVLSCLVLSCLVLSCLVLSCLVLSCLSSGHVLEISQLVMEKVEVSIQGLWFSDEGLVMRVRNYGSGQGLGCRVQNSGVEGLGFRVESVGPRVQGPRFRDSNLGFSLRFRDQRLRFKV